MLYLGTSDPGVLLKDPGVLLKDPGVLLKVLAGILHLLYFTERRSTAQMGAVDERPGWAGRCLLRAACWLSLARGPFKGPRGPFKGPRGPLK